jgi:K+-sensing histidine kinase KdpD
VATAQGGERIFEVRDNGVGFPPAQAPHLFRAFHRAAGAGEPEGVGLGLAIVERIVHRHGGRVWATGEEGRGASFSFSLGTGTGTGTGASAGTSASASASAPAAPERAPAPIDSELARAL